MQDAADAAWRSKRGMHVLETVSDVMWEADARLLVTYVSSRDREQRGYGPEEVIGKHWFSFLTSASEQHAMKAIADYARLSQQGRRDPLVLPDIQQVCKDGRVIWTDIAMTAVLENGVLAGFVGITRDTTELKRQKAALRDCSERLDGMQQQMERCSARRSGGPPTSSRRTSTRSAPGRTTSRPTTAAAPGSRPRRCRASSCSTSPATPASPSSSRAAAPSAASSATSSRSSAVIPRLKSAEQVLAELEALRRLGWRGPLFFVDDNFIGNRRAVAALLPRITAWQRQHGRPFDLYTEASLDLASHPELVDAMVEAGFTAVFVGLESPSPESLKAAGKVQNLMVDPAEGVRRLTAAGFEVFAGFILGFDTDHEDIFEWQRSFIAGLPVPRAMVGLLGALPNTALWRRLEKEGRLRRAQSGDQFGRPNFEPALDERVLLQGYRRLLASLYSAEAFYHRCRLHLESVKIVPAPVRPGALPG